MEGTRNVAKLILDAAKMKQQVHDNGQNLHVLIFHALTNDQLA